MGRTLRGFPADYARWIVPSNLHRCSSQDNCRKYYDLSILLNSYRNHKPIHKLRFARYLLNVSFIYNQDTDKKEYFRPRVMKVWQSPATDVATICTQSIPNDIAMPKDTPIVTQSQSTLSLEFDSLFSSGSSFSFVPFTLGLILVFHLLAQGLIYGPNRP